MRILAVCWSIWLERVSQTHVDLFKGCKNPCSGSLCFLHNFLNEAVFGCNLLSLLPISGRLALDKYCLCAQSITDLTSQSDEETRSWRNTKENHLVSLFRALVQVITTISTVSSAFLCGGEKDMLWESHGMGELTAQKEIMCGEGKPIEDKVDCIDWIDSIKVDISNMKKGNFFWVLQTVMDLKHIKNTFVFYCTFMVHCFPEIEIRAQHSKLPMQIEQFCFFCFFEERTTFYHD